MIPKFDGLTEDQVRSLIYCRTYAQYLAMSKVYRAGGCPFCDPINPKTNLIIAENGCWRMWENPFPVTHTEFHLVMAPKRHVAPGDDIALEDFTDMGYLFRWAQRKYHFTGGGFVMRFGPPLQNAGTVLHLHAHIIVPDQTGAVKATLAKAPEMISAGIARMYVFEKIYKGADIEMLTEEERKLVVGRL